jgi:hypothetical protein
MAKKRSGSFGARPCYAIRARYFAGGVDALPKSWRRNWMIARIVATPPWADFKAIRVVYAQAAYMTLKTGELHTVDHVIPLQHPRVCGLHVPENMQVLHHIDNGAKSNYFCPEQMEFVF